MKSDLLKEAIADAKAVKETALANAKMALEEAFTPKLQSMLSHKLAEELDDEEEEVSDIASDVIESHEEEMHSEEEEVSEEDEVEETYESEDDEVSEEEEMMDEEEDELDLESVIAELEAALGDEEAEEVSEEEDAEEVSEEEEATEEMYEEGEEGEDLDEELSLDEIIATLKEMADEEEAVEEVVTEEEDEEDATAELEEAYKTIESLRSTINEVNLLNAKLLYTNKLFRTFDLNEGQKMKVIENFDRAESLREVKLVFATLGENLNVAKKPKAVVKESLASKPMKSSAPKKEIISEGNLVADRFKKLAGLIK